MITTTKPNILSKLGREKSWQYFEENKWMECVNPGKSVARGEKNDWPAAAGVAMAVVGVWTKKVPVWTEFRWLITGKSIGVREK